MASSFSSLVNNLSKGILEIKRKYGHNNKNINLLELNVNTVTGFLNTHTLKVI